ncbi:ATP-dependent Clp protease proteolytic subunit [Staphylococcus aureus]
MNLIPTVIEQQTAVNVHMIYTHVVLKDRIIMLGSQIDDNVANSIVSQLLFLQAQDSEKIFILYINSTQVGSVQQLVLPFMIYLIH